LDYEAKEGYTSKRQQDIVGKGGTCILMDLIWAKFVMDYTTIGSNKTQVITLKGLPCGDLGIINISAPNNYVDRNISWELLLEKIPRNYSWIVCGEFNMVEDKEDKFSMCGRLIPNKEGLLWDALKLALEIHEPTRSNRNLKFSWDNQRSGRHKIMVRLDHIYIPNYLASNQAGNSPQYYVKGDGVRSNHHHVSCLLEIVKTIQTLVEISQIVTSPFTTMRLVVACD